MSRTLVCSLIASLFLVTACKSPEEAAAKEREKKLSSSMEKGKAALATQDYRTAAQAFKDATFISDSPEPFFLLAQTHREGGNKGAAMMALKEVEQRFGALDPQMRRQLAELYLDLGAQDLAFRTFQSLRNARELTDADLRRLAQLQAAAGQIDEAFATLEPMLTANPDDPLAKTVEAEILLLSGDELLATKLLDRLLNENAALAPARLLRARYFLNNGYPQYADADLSLLPPEDAGKPQAVTLRARALNTLGRYAESEALVDRLMATHGKTPAFLALQADTKLQLDRVDDAAALVDEALRMSPMDPQALYTRGRILERQVQPQQARDAYARALAASPGFAPALGRMWHLHDEAGQKREAMEALERLYLLGEASIDEKAALAAFYVDFSIQLTRARQLIDEALRRDPENLRWKAIRASIGKRGDAPERQRGPAIIRPRR